MKTDKYRRDLNDPSGCGGRVGGFCSANDSSLGVGGLLGVCGGYYSVNAVSLLVVLIVTSEAESFLAVIRT